MNLAAVLIGIPSLLFGLLIAYGLIRRFNGNLNDAPQKNCWILGVCEDFSRMVGMPLWLMRVFFLIYTPLFPLAALALCKLQNGLVEQDDEEVFKLLPPR